MNSTIIIIGIVVVIILLAVSAGVAYYLSQNSSSEESSDEPKTCPDVFGYGIKPAGTVVTVGCELGPTYTGNVITKCNADGSWTQENNCVSSGNTDLVDISGDWNIMYGGNVGTATIVFNKNTGTGTVTATGTDEPGRQLLIGPKDIKYISGKGYAYNGNQAAAFTDKTYNRLDGGNYAFSRI